VYSVSIIICIVVCCVLFERGVLFCVMCVICVLCLFVVPLPLGKNPFAVKVNNNTKSNNNFYKYIKRFIYCFIV
jgi:hypothetical protein